MKSDKQRIRELQAMAIKIEVMIGRSDHLSLEVKEKDLILCSSSRDGERIERVIDLIPF